MKNPILLIFFLTYNLIAMSETKVYTCNEYGSNKKQFMSLDAGKVFSTNEYGSNKKQFMFIEAGKVFNCNEYGSNKKQFMLIESGKAYTTNEYGSNKKQFLLIEAGKVYTTNEYGSNKKQIALYEANKIYTTNEYGSNKKQIGLIEGGASLAEMVVIMSRFALFWCYSRTTKSISEKMKNILIIPIALLCVAICITTCNNSNAKIPSFSKKEIPYKSDTILILNLEFKETKL